VKSILCPCFVRLKTVINCKANEQVQTFSFLDCDVSHCCVDELGDKLSRFEYMSRTIKKNNKTNKTRKDTQILPDNSNCFA
jgi:hypothetical protein